MPKAPPSFDFFYNDWICGTSHMSHVEKSCYLDLLIYQWQNGHIPLEPAQRMSLCRINDPNQWADIWHNIGDKFDVIGYSESMPPIWEKTSCGIPQKTAKKAPLLANRRMCVDRDASIRRWEKQRENGKKGGRPKTKPNGFVWVNPNETILEGGRKKRITTKEKESAVADARKFDPSKVELAFGSHEFASAWSDWCEHRIEIKRPLTERSVKQQMDDFREIGEQRAVTMIRHTVRNGWQGLREPDTQRANGSNVKPLTREDFANF